MPTSDDKRGYLPPTLGASALPDWSFGERKQIDAAVDEVRAEAVRICNLCTAAEKPELMGEFLRAGLTSRQVEDYFKRTGGLQ